MNFPLLKELYLSIAAKDSDDNCISNVADAARFNFPLLNQLSLRKAINNHRSQLCESTKINGRFFNENCKNSSQTVMYQL